MPVRGLNPSPESMKVGELLYYFQFSGSFNGLGPPFDIELGIYIVCMAFYGV